MNETDSEQEELKRVPIKYYYPEDVKAEFANRFGAHYLREDGVFLVNFFQVEQPPLYGTQEERREKVKELEHVNAKAIASIIVTPEKITSLIEHLLDIVNKNAEEAGIMFEEADEDEQDSQQS